MWSVGAAGTPAAYATGRKDVMLLRRSSALAIVLAFAGCSGKPAPGASATPPPSPSAYDLQKPLPSPLPEVAARVNGLPVAMWSVGARAKAAAGHEKEELTPERVAVLYREALGHLIDRELLFQEAVTRHLAADDTQVEQAYNQARVGYHDDAAWNAYLAEQGFDDAAFRTELR